MRTFGIGVLLVLLLSSAAAAQAVSTASIGGTVRDGSGAVLPGVTVTRVDWTNPAREP